LKKLLFVVTLYSIISCQKSTTVEPELPKCFITKISETARDSKNSLSKKAIIDYDIQQRISKVTDPDGDRLYVTYVYEKGKVTIKSFSRNNLEYTRSLILNDKNQVIQDLVQNGNNKTDTITYAYNAQGFLSNTLLKEYGYAKKIELKYEYNNDGSPSKVIVSVVYGIGITYSYYKNYEYDNNLIFASMPNKNEIYPKFIHENIESLFPKVIKATKAYSSDNQLSSEQSFKYVMGTDNKKVKSITTDSYGTLNGVRNESSLVNNVQEFEYLCK
jgi:hypothetical protein